jgi:hypothetical protein
VSGPAVKTFGGTFLTPGVSLNHRLYTKELIGKAVARMQARIADPDGLPIVMRSHHAAGDDSRLVVARVLQAEQAPDGSGTYRARWYDTAPARDIAALVQPADGGPPGLRSVSIHGYFIEPYEVEVNGETVVTASDLEVTAIDYTATPGVVKALVDSETAFAESTGSLASGSGRIPIVETWEPPMPAPRPAVAPLMPADQFAALLAEVREMRAATIAAQQPTPEQLALAEAAEIRSLTDAQLSARLLERLTQRAGGRTALTESADGPAPLSAAVEALPTRLHAVTLTDAVTAARDPQSPLWTRGAGIRTFFTA